MSDEFVVPDKVDKVIATYRDIRDKLAAERKVFKARENDLKERLELLSGWLKLKAEEVGVDGFKTPYGTAFEVKKEYYRIDDFDAFTSYLMETGNFQLLEKRVAKLAAKEVHDEEGIPPGIAYSSEIEYQVRKPSK